mgnify:CR=1 FL=1
MDSNWLKDRFGRALLDVEINKLAESLPDLHGHYLLQYSEVNVPIIKSTTLRHQFTACNERLGQLQMDYQHLPFRDNSLDCVVTHHVLDYDQNPHQCLREAARVVVPNGYLVVVGFNPWSALGVSRILPKSLIPIGGRHLTPRRVIDWLVLLGFRIEQRESVQFLPPFALKYAQGLSLKVDSCLSYLSSPFGGVYILIARKLVAGRTPIRPQWRILPGQRMPVPLSRARGVRRSP